MNTKRNKIVIIVIIFGKRPLTKTSITIHVVLSERRNGDEERKTRKNLSYKLKIRFQRSYSVICQRASRSMTKLRKEKTKLSMEYKNNPLLSAEVLSLFLEIKLRIVNLFQFSVLLCERKSTWTTKPVAFDKEKSCEKIILHHCYVNRSLKKKNGSAAFRGIRIFLEIVL